CTGFPTRRRSTSARARTNSTICTLRSTRRRHWPSNMSACLSRRDWNCEFQSLRVERSETHQLDGADGKIASRTQCVPLPACGPLAGGGEAARSEIHACLPPLPRDLPRGRQQSEFAACADFTSPQYALVSSTIRPG